MRTVERVGTLRALAAGGAVAASAAVLAAGPVPGARAQFDGPPANPLGITSGPGGSIWFTEGWSDRIGRITAAGAIREFGTGRDSRPLAIASGPDGNLWFTQQFRDRIGRMTPGGVVTNFSRGLSPSSGPRGIAAGPDGNMWFTETDGNRIGRITPEGIITEFSNGLSPDGAPVTITPGPDGNMWFTETDGNRIGRITPEGIITEFSNGLGPALRGLAVGPDGNIWFTAARRTGGLRFGRLTPAGLSTIVGTTESPSGTDGITAGPDGNLWINDGGGSAVIRVSTAGAVRRFRVPGTGGGGSDDFPAGIVAGPDGNLWFTSPQLSSVGRITPDGVIQMYPPITRATGVRGGAGTVRVRLRCPASACAGILRAIDLDEGPGVPIGERRFRLGAGRSGTVAVPLSARGRRLLARRGQIPVVVTLQPLEHSRLGVTVVGDVGFLQPAPVTTPATVLEVTDGDTVAVRLDGRRTVLRLAGITAPQVAPRSSVDMCFGPAAARALRRALPPGTHVTVLTVPGLFSPDTLGRRPAHLFLRGRRGLRGSVSFAMVAGGYAQAAGSGDILRDGPLARIAEKVKSERRGLWGPPCNGDLTRPDPGA